MRTTGEWVYLISKDREVRVRAQIGRSLIGSVLTNPARPRPERRIRSLKSGSNLLPCQGLLSESVSSQNCAAKHSAAQTPDEPLHAPSSPHLLGSLNRGANANQKTVSI